MTPSTPEGVRGPSAAVEADHDVVDPRGIPFALSGVARGGALNVAAAACSQLCVFATVTVIARELGGRAVGEYTLGWAFLVVIGFFALWGFQVVLIRFVPIHLADGDAARVRGTVRLSMRASLGLSVLLAIAIAALAGPVSHSVHQAHLHTELILVAVSLPAATVRDAALAATQGWQSQRASALVASIYEPIIRLALTCGSVAAGWGVTGAFAAIPVGAWSAAVLAVISLHRRLQSVPSATPTVDVRAMWRFSTVSLGTVIASAGLIWADILILGVLRSARELGIYNVSTRIVNVAVFVMVPVVSALEPRLSNLLHQGAPGPLKHAYATTTRWVLALSLPAFVVLLVYASDLLRLFGPEYVAGAAVTVVLACSQLWGGVTGAGGPMLNLSGRVRLTMINNCVALALNVGLNLLLIPHFGIIGAAVAWGISLAVINTACVVEVKVIFGIWPFDRSIVKVTLAAVFATLAAVWVRLLISNHLAELLVGSACAVVCYVIAMALLGIEPDDRAAIRSIASGIDIAGPARRGGPARKGTHRAVRSGSSR